ncbi:hypothetical protein JOL62DRAFT_564489 [Phyllosticta paracitricarpa]|uniref:TPR-like protein n=1 Tax=Phyllosticta paracitricarpa TaxID=2016321 RepID=A0ABR1NGB9_9PEZI
MPPSNPHVATQLRQLVYYHLDNDLIHNALFIAGRLHGQEPRSADAAHLFALCHLRLGNLKAAYDYSREKGFRGHHLGCAYVFAQACLGLQRYSDGITALDRARGFWGGRNHWNKHSETVRRHVPDAAAVNCLLGKLWRAHGDVSKAIASYTEALKLNPFMWDAFIDLCDTGAVIRTSNIFKMTPEMSAFLSTSSLNVMASDSPPGHSNLAPPGPNGFFTPGNDPFNSSIPTGTRNGGGLFSKFNGFNVPNGNPAHAVDAETPAAGSGSHDEDVMMGEAGGSGLGRATTEPPHAPVRRSRQAPTLTDSGVDVPKMKSMTTRSRVRSGTDTSGNEEPSKPSTTAQKRTISGNMAQSSTASAAPTSQPRRSHRLMQSVQDHIRPSSSRTLSSARDVETKEREKREMRRARLPTAARSSKTSANSGVGRVISGNRKPIDVADRERDLKESRPASVAAGAASKAPEKETQALQELAKEKEALQWLLELFGKFGSGYYHLSRYSLLAAFNEFTALPSSQRETPWVLAQIGKAWFERGQYSEAAEIFEKVKQMVPSRMEDMEIYSTVLWHLKRETELAYLAHELIEADRLSPQAWCAIGNSFSLQREHDHAIKCFKRATQLDPKFAYAFTLQGHEHVANEEFDKALLAYRNAISADHRHYNGWYGLGRVYDKMGKYDIAEKHFKNAAQINPTNAVLIVCIGMVLEKMRKPQAALRQYSIACELDPKSALARFKKARALMNLRQPREALAEFEILKELAPDEANVHFMLGRLHKMMGDKTNAIRHFTVALNLDPKASQYIKEAMESLEDDDDDDEYDEV